MAKPHRKVKKANHGARPANAKARKRKRAAVDRRASKGRKLRFTVEPKLVNFTTPAPRDTTDLLVDELFAGLFK